ncbi:MAG: ABC transporter permease [Phycisphaerae bacterium]
MRKVIVIAVREYQAAVKTKAFIISIVLMPVLMGGAIMMQAIMHDRVDTKDKRIAILDQSDVLFDTIAEAARQRDETDVFRGEGAERKKVRPRFLIDKARVSSNEPAKITYELSERVRNGELFAFVIIGPEAVHPGDDPARDRVAYYSNSPTYDDFHDWVAPRINTRVRQLRFEAFDIEPAVVNKAISWVNVTNLGLVSLDDQGQITEAKETNRAANLLIPMGMMMLMLMVVMVSASPLMQSVLEEKMQRIAEVLLGSVTPFQLMMGKLIGIVGVSLTMATIYLVGAFFAVHRTGFGQLFPAHLVWWFVVFQIMAVLLFGSVFAAIGAAVSDMKEAQSLMTPVMVVVMVPLFLWVPVVKEPVSTFATVVSLIPPATPMLMILRQSVPPGIPLWQPLLGVVLVLATTTACVFVAGRVFRVGILMQGKGANVGEMIRWALRG